MNKTEFIDFSGWKPAGSWLINPKNGKFVQVGSGALIPTSCKLGDRVRIGDGVVLGEHTEIGSYTIIGERVRIGKDVTVGKRAVIGDSTVIRDGVTIGNNFRCDNYVSIHDGVFIGNDVEIASCSKILEEAQLYDCVGIKEAGTVIGEKVIVRDGYSCDDIRKDLIAGYADVADTHVFWKWVNPDRTYDGITYKKGAVIENHVYGIPVARPGYRPEWIRLVDRPYDDLIRVKVKVRSEDILDAGTPGDDAELRARRLEVIS